MSNEPFTTSYQPLPPEEEDRIGSLLRLHLARDEIASRAGAGQSRYQYLTTNKSIELANWIFGHDGWSSAIQDITIDFLEESKDNRWNVGVSCIMRITLRGGSFHEDVGYGQTVNMPGKAEALEKAKKEACSDGLKRAMRLFGNKLGNCLGDQQYMALLKSGKGQKEPLDLSQSPRKRMKLEPALTASTQMQQQQQQQQQQHNNNSTPLSSHPPTEDGYPVSPQQLYQQPPPATSPNMPVSPNAIAPPPPPQQQSPAALSSYNRQPVPSPPAAVAPSSASFPYKPRNASTAPPPRPVSLGKENAYAGGGVPMDTSSSNAPLPSIQSIKNSLPAAAHAAASTYASAAFTPAVKQEGVPNATAPYGPPSTVARTFTANHAPQPNNISASRPYIQPSPPTATAASDAATVAMSPPNATNHNNTAYGYAPAVAGSSSGGVSYAAASASGGSATFPGADGGGGGFMAADGSGVGGSAPPMGAAGSFFGSDDDDGSGIISQWLTHGAGQAGAPAVANNA